MEHVGSIIFQNSPRSYGLTLGSPHHQVTTPGKFLTKLMVSVSTWPPATACDTDTFWRSSTRRLMMVRPSTATSNMVVLSAHPCWQSPIATTAEKLRYFPRSGHEVLTGVSELA